MNVTLHYCDIDKVRLPIEDLSAALVSEEEVRARRFHRKADQLRFCVGRVMLREILAAHTGRTAKSIELSTGPHGKPYADCGPSFNLSHSGSTVMLGVAESGDVGVDVELVRPLEDLDQLVSRCFSDSEREALEAQTEPEKTQSFYRTWTRKEAFVKALGGGLNVDLKSFSVSMHDSVGNVLLDASLCCSNSDDWSIRPVLFPNDFVAAVAWNRRSFLVELKEFEVGFTES